VFLRPGVLGQEPESRALSADGRWLLFRWRALERDGGALRLEDERGPRLISTVDPAASGHRGVALVDLLPPEVAAAEPGELRWAFFPEGGDLAVARGARVLRLRAPRGGDPRAFAAELALDLAAGAPEGEVPAVEGLAFDPARGHLRVRCQGRELAFPHADRLPWSAADGLAAAQRFPSGTEAEWSEDRGVAFSRDAPLAWLDPSTGTAHSRAPAAPGAAGGSQDSSPASAPGPGEAPAPSAAPPGSLAAYVWRRADDRYVVLDGFDGRGPASLSPGGRRVIATDADEAAAPLPTLVPDYLTERVTTREARRQWAEDGAYPERTWAWDTESGARTEIPLDAGMGAWTTPIGWAPRPAAGAPERFAWHVVRADLAAMELWVWGEGGLERVYEERDPRWYGGPAATARWTPGGRALVFGSECTRLSLSPGRSQLFAVDAEGGAVRQLTEVAGEVSDFQVLEDGSVVFVASQADPARRSVGIVPAAAVRGERGGARTWARMLPQPDGWNDSPRASADGSRLVFAHQTLGRPAELWAVELGGASPARELTRTLPEEYAAIDWIRPRRFRAEHPDGTPIHAHVFLPPESALERPDRPRAAIVFFHGAGYLQNVTDSMTEYPLNLLFHSRLARMGYAVVDVDYRGSAGYGGAFRTDVQYALGKLELEDVHAVLGALAGRGVIDPARVACYGGSYGGFLALMALFTEGERWVAGAALRSVTDWRTYQPRYTQPRLGRPSTHPEAYLQSSPIHFAKDLEDPLLLLHGMVDSNVFAQDTIRLIEELIDLGKDFEAMLYPSQGHDFEDGRHWLDEYRRIERFLTRHLGPP
jgi:dipeptidyl aminopeptidase/acylaminoacyl peptidase